MERSTNRDLCVWFKVGETWTVLRDAANLVQNEDFTDRVFDAETIDGLGSYRAESISTCVGGGI
ncbi:MAG: hypothetical protein HZA46_01065 [Planctomycetales bacterium]|nr:hypothetical protein [Planctomycetales bacterium]